MRRFVVIVCLISLAVAQRGRPSRQSHNGHGWDIRLAVPGEPGSDYPTLGAIPRTSFSCAGKEPGYYADIETNCQVFRICTIGSTYGFQSFLCPNGTLFNQAVFVCDWWMNVNCQISQELFNNHNDQFGNLRLGPQLMKDIKKMITHPMRNPYDKLAMKSNLIVMQDYKPPLGQMFPNGALIAGPDRIPNSVYLPAKQIQNYNQNVYSNNAFAASSPSPQYLPPLNTPGGDTEVFQKQRHNVQFGQFTQNGRLQSTQPTGNIISNGHTGQFIQNKNTVFNNGNSISRPTQTYHAEYNQRPTNFGNIQSFQIQNNQRGQLKYAKYTDNRVPVQLNSGKEQESGISFSKQQHNYNSNQEKQVFANKSPLPISNENIRYVKNDAKQNLESKNDVPATIVTKTLTFNRIIQDPKPGQPKSRITFKTWIVKPSKSAKLIADSTPYSYDKPTQSTLAKLVDQPSPYIYNPPTSPAQVERIVSHSVEEPYTYNKPTVAAKQRASDPEGPYVYDKPTVAAKQIESHTDGESYVYNKPTVAAKQIATTVRESSRFYLTPTAPPPTLSGRLYLTPMSVPPTVSSRIYLAPTTYKPAANLYLPPSQANIILSRQYLTPNSLQPPSYYQNEQLRVSPTSPVPVYAAPNNENTNNPLFTLTKHSHINANHNNLTFADILTKEKLDITVNDIVSDTSKVLKTAAPQLEQYRQDKPEHYSEDEYLPSDQNESDEKLTPQSPTVSTSSRLIVDPSRDLEPPMEDYNNVQNVNPLSSLPFFKEPSANTIERTVSLKISIPEKVASYLFKSRNESDYDKLEILNTGSSNYLVLTNNLIPKATSASFIPIGRLIADKSSNISDSQALVFSFLTDSLNAARQYSNIAHHNVISSASSQFQNDEDLSHITNKISQLTASQYSAQNHNFNHADILSTSSTVTNGGNQNRPAKFTNQHQNQPQQFQSAQINLASQINQGFNQYKPSKYINHGQNQSQKFQSAQIKSEPQTNQGYAPQLSNLHNNQIYSGQLYQLPVPDVTSQIYNAGSAKVIQAQQQGSEADHLHEGNRDNSLTNTPNQNIGKHSDEVENIHTQGQPLTPAKLQVAPSNENDFNSQEHSAQAFNFLNNGDGIAAQVRDKIIGTIQHPLEENKRVTYKKDQSYYVFTKLDNEAGNIQNNIQSNAEQSAKLIQNTNTPNIVSFQFVPSVSYHLEDEKEQQKVLNVFQLDHFGKPKKANLIQNKQNVVTSVTDVNYAIEHPISAKQVEGTFNDVNTLYTGPSSYSAPQASVGSLEAKDRNGQSNVIPRLEQLDENHKTQNGYARVSPARPFSF